MSRQLAEKNEQNKGLTEMVNEKGKKIREKEFKIQELQSSWDAAAKKYEIVRKSEEKKSLVS